MVNQGHAASQTETHAELLRVGAHVRRGEVPQLTIASKSLPVPIPCILGPVIERWDCYAAHALVSAGVSEKSAVFSKTDGKAPPVSTKNGESG